MKPVIGLFWRGVDISPSVNRLKDAGFAEDKINVLDYLMGIQKEYMGKGLRVQVCAEEGAVVNTIIRVAEREAADLIAMSSHGRTGLARVFYGSVAAGVLQQVDRPLLIIRSEAEE